MTSEPLAPPGGNISPYLRMKLRDAPKPHIDAPAVQLTEAAPPALSEIPPFARPGIKI